MTSFNIKVLYFISSLWIAMILLGGIICFNGIKPWIQQLFFNQWEETEGVVLSAKVDKVMPARFNSDEVIRPHYLPQIVYRYKVNDVTYTNSRYQLGEVAVNIRARAESIVNGYHQNQGVKVYYKNDHPQKSTLVTQVSTLSFGTVIGGMIFILVGYKALVITLKTIKEENNPL